MHTLDTKYAKDIEQAKLFKLIKNYEKSQHEIIFLEDSKRKSEKLIEQKFKSSEMNKKYKLLRTMTYSEHSKTPSYSSLQGDFIDLYAQNYKL